MVRFKTGFMISYPLNTVNLLMGKQLKIGIVMGYIPFDFRKFFDIPYPMGYLGNFDLVFDWPAFIKPTVFEIVKTRQRF
jgi:hypothetical protein